MEAVLVIVAVVGLIFWLRSKQSKADEDQNLRYFQYDTRVPHEDPNRGRQTYCIDFQTMTGNDGAFHVRRVSPIKWQEKPTEDEYDRWAGLVFKSKERHTRRIEDLERELEEATKIREDWLERDNALNSANKLTQGGEPSDADYVQALESYAKWISLPEDVIARLEDKLSKERLELEDDEQELKSYAKWISLPEDVIGPLETQYQQYLLHGARTQHPS